MPTDNLDRFRDEDGLLPCICFGPDDPVDTLPDGLLESLVQSGDPRPEVRDELQRRYDTRAPRPGSGLNGAGTTPTREEVAPMSTLEILVPGCERSDFTDEQWEDIAAVAREGALAAAAQIRGRVGRT